MDAKKFPASPEHLWGNPLIQSDDEIIAGAKARAEAAAKAKPGLKRR